MLTGQPQSNISPRKCQVPAGGGVNALNDAISALNFLHDLGDVFEICIIQPKKFESPLWEGRANGKGRIVSGWFNDPEAAAKLAVKISENITAEGIYTTLNPCKPAIHARAKNRLKASVDRTADNHIKRLKNLLIDVDADPGGVTGVSSTNTDHEAALEMAQAIQADLLREGWPEPMPADSGNGAHLNYALDLPNTPENVTLIKEVLLALNLRYQGPLSQRNLGIDTSVFNPARLTKLYGTWVRKGDDTDTQPHRLAKILSLPEVRRPVPLELLKKLAATVPSREPPQDKNAEAGTRRLDLDAYLPHYGIEVVKKKPHAGGVLYCLENCLFDPSHSNNEASIFQAADGMLSYQCFHDSCKKRGHTWAEARAIISRDDKLTAFMVGGQVARKKSKAPETITGFNLTDLGNAQRLVARHGQDMRYCYPWSKWLVWDGVRWAKDESGEVDRRAKETVRNIYAEAATIKDKDSRAAMADHAKRSESDSKRQAMINSARSELGISVLPSDFDRDYWLLNVLNGTIDLKTGKLRTPRREDLITKLAPVVYDAKAKCPIFWKFLEQIFNRNHELIFFLQKAVGYAMTGITCEQCLFFLHGLGANGKTTFLEVIQTMMGDYATQTTSETFMVKRHGNPITNDVADLRGARFVSAVEIESGRRMAEVLIKQMTGGDRLKARFLYSENFEFKPEFKIFLAANHKPVIQGTDTAIWRRIRLIPFTVQIPETEQDRKLPEKLKAELPGILNWAIEGCINWQDHGLAPPKEVKAATQEYREEMDTLADFLAECCIVDTGASALASILYKKYTAWADDSGEKKPFSQKVFGTALAERGFERGRATGGPTLWKGIGVKE